MKQNEEVGNDARMLAARLRFVLDHKLPIEPSLIKAAAFALEREARGGRFCFWAAVFWMMAALLVTVACG